MAKKNEKKALASKQTLNLAVRERDITKSPALALGVILLILAVAALISWAVGSRLAQVTAAQKEVDAIEENIRQMAATYADFDEVKAQYNRYTYKDYDRSIADRLDVMALMERQVFPVCQVRSFSVAGRQMSLVLEGLTLDSTSALISSLNAEPMVGSVSVSTYDATSDTGVVYSLTNMIIVLSDATQTGEVGQ